MRVKTFFKKIGSLIVTKEIFEDKKSLRILYRYFLAGLLIRLIFIPFFFHVDLLSAYQRAAETISTGNLGFDNVQMFSNLIHTLYLFIIKSIFPAINEVFSVLLEKDTAWIILSSSYNVFTVLTLFKILYLIFDIACMFLILRLSFDDKPEDKLRVFKFWIFNPIVIFVLYIFARHDIIGVFATLVALLLAKKDRKYWAIIVLGFGIAIRFFPIMILPILVFYLARTKKDYIILSLIGVSSLAVVELLSVFYLGKSVIFSLLNSEHFDFLLSPKLDLVIGSHSSIFIFMAVYIFIILSFLHIKKKNFDILLNYCAIIYLAYVGICYFHPQYMLWIVPFLVIIFARRRHLLYYHWVQFALLLVILIYWVDHTTKLLFIPIDHKYFLYLTSINSIIRRFYDDAKFVNIFRSIFTGVSLWMIYLIYKDNKKILSDELKNREN